MTRRKIKKTPGTKSRSNTSKQIQKITIFMIGLILGMLIMYSIDDFLFTLPETKECEEEECESIECPDFLIENFSFRLDLTYFFSGENITENEDSDTLTGLFRIDGNIANYTITPRGDFMSLIKHNYFKIKIDDITAFRFNIMCRSNQSGIGFNIGLYNIGEDIFYKAFSNVLIENTNWNNYSINFMANSTFTTSFIESNLLNDYILLSKIEFPSIWQENNINIEIEEIYFQIDIANINIDDLEQYY